MTNVYLVEMYNKNGTMSPRGNPAVTVAQLAWADTEEEAIAQIKAKEPDMPDLYKITRSK